MDIGNQPKPQFSKAQSILNGFNTSLECCLKRNFWCIVTFNCHLLTYLLLNVTIEFGQYRILSLSEIVTTTVVTKVLHSFTVKSQLLTLHQPLPILPVLLLVPLPLQWCSVECAMAQCRVCSIVCSADVQCAVMQCVVL